MIAKPMIASSSFDWILSGIEESSLYPSITIKSPLSDIDYSDSSNDNKCHPSSSSISSKSFTWSDFPCYGDEQDEPSVPISSRSQSNTTTATMNHINSEIDTDDDDNDMSLSKLTYSLRDYIPSMVPPPSSPPSPTSCCDVLSMDDTVLDQIPQSSSLLPIPNSTTSNHHHYPRQSKRVTFAPLVRVRTHTIVLGDHPMCSGGMALQLGWESSPTQYIPLNTSISSSSSSSLRGTTSLRMMIRSTTSTTKRSLSQIRLNYQQRRQRLMELTGYTSSQLLHQEYLLVCCSSSGGGNSNLPTTTSTGDV